MARSDSRVDRSVSVSSIRRMKLPLPCRASNQLNKAVRALPTWRWPVGDGANLTRIVKDRHEYTKDTNLLLTP